METTFSPTRGQRPDILIYSPDDSAMNAARVELLKIENERMQKELKLKNERIETMASLLAVRSGLRVNNNKQRSTPPVATFSLRKAKLKHNLKQSSRNSGSRRHQTIARPS